MSTTGIAARHVTVLDGKTYDLTFYANGYVGVHVQTRRGLRTLNGHGRAYRGDLIAKVVRQARAELEVVR